MSMLSSLETSFNLGTSCREEGWRGGSGAQTSLANQTTLADANFPTVVSANRSHGGARTKEGTNPKGLFPSSNFGWSGYLVEMTCLFGLVSSSGVGLGSFPRSLADIGSFRGCGGVAEDGGRLE